MVKLYHILILKILICIFIFNFQHSNLLLGSFVRTLGWWRTFEHIVLRPHPVHGSFHCVTPCNRPTHARVFVVRKYSNQQRERRPAAYMLIPVARPSNGESPNRYQRLTSQLCDSHPDTPSSDNPQWVTHIQFNRARPLLHVWPSILPVGGLMDSCPVGGTSPLL